MKLTDSKTKSCQWNGRVYRKRDETCIYEYSLCTTGMHLKKLDYTYANYKVRHDSGIADSSGIELADTKTSDYIIYTNARIYQQIIKTN